jgi:hypothetical protein
MNNFILNKIQVILPILAISSLLILGCKARKQSDNFIHTTPQIRELTYPKEVIARKKPHIIVRRVFYYGPEFHQDGQAVDVDFMPLSLGIDTITFSERILKEFKFPSVCDNSEEDRIMMFKVSKDSLNKFENIEIMIGSYCAHDIAEIKKIISTYPLLVVEKSISSFYLGLRIEYK